MKNHRSLTLLAVSLITAICVGLSPSFARAEDGSQQLSLQVTADKTAAHQGDNVTFTYVLTNTGSAGVDNITASDNKAGLITLPAGALGPGENMTASAIYTIKSSDYPGPLANVLTATATTGDNITITATITGSPITLIAETTVKTKAEILISSGVPGKGIANAPGLQKPFNENSQAANHAGKKDKDKGNGKDKNKEND